MRFLGFKFQALSRLRGEVIMFQGFSFLERYLSGNRFNFNANFVTLSDILTFLQISIT